MNISYEGNLLKTIERIQRRLPVAVKRAVVVAVNFSRQRFKEGAWMDTTKEPWAPLADKTLRYRKFKGRGVLYQSGFLRDSIHSEQQSTYVYLIVASAPYARAHNEGVNTTVQVPAHTRRLVKKVKSTFTDRRGKIRSRTEKVAGDSIPVKAHGRRMQLKQRKFLGSSAYMRKLMALEILRTLKQ